MIDTHCHLDFNQFDPDRDAVLERAKKSGVNYIINVGSCVEGSEKSVDLAKKHEDIFASVGIHPHHADEIKEDDFEKISELAKDKKVIEIYSADNAVGENNYLIPAKINGPETEAAFNWRYLLDGVRIGSTKEVFMGLNGDERPTLIKNPGDDTSFYILMPIKPV